MLVDKNESFLSLIRLGLGKHSFIFPSVNDWGSIVNLSNTHGLLAIVLDGIERMPEEKRPPKELLLQWRGEALQDYEYRYEIYRRAIASLADFYNSHGFKMMILKGYACSLSWPKPEHRPCGDIDIWLFGQQKEADRVLAKEKKITIDNCFHHHTVFFWRDFMVENHYDFINIHHHKSNRELERILKKLGEDDSHFVELTDVSTSSATKVYLPSPNLHALFLIRHCMTDFASAFLSLRQIVDWAFFVEKHTKDIDWKWLLEVLKRFHLVDFFNCINAICVEDLGFETRIFPYVQFEPGMKERIFNEILSPQFTEVEPHFFVCRLFFKYRRWRANAWKHRLCYNESLWSAFWSGVWSHILKPSSI